MRLSRKNKIIASLFLFNLIFKIHFIQLQHTENIFFQKKKRKIILFITNCFFIFIYLKNAYCVLFLNCFMWVGYRFFLILILVDFSDL